MARRFDAMTAPGAAYRVRLKDAGSNDLGLVWETEIDHQRVQLFKEPSRGWGQRVKERLIGLLPLQPEL